MNADKRGEESALSASSALKCLKLKTGLFRFGSVGARSSVLLQPPNFLGLDSRVM